MLSKKHYTKFGKLELGDRRRHPFASSITALRPAPAEVLHRMATRALAAMLPTLLAACGGGGADTPAAIAQPQDDTAALQTLLDQGGVVRLEARTYHLSKTLILSRSGTVLEGAGNATVLEYTSPPATPQQCVNDRVMTMPCALFHALPRQIGAPIAVGDTSFQATQASDVADLSPGTWLIVNDYDEDIGDRVAVDWAQVVSVVGLTVNVASPFRMAFTTARAWIPRKSGLGFEPVAAISGVQLRNFSVVVDHVPSANFAGVCVFGALNTTIDHVSVTNFNGQPFYSYLSKGLTITNSSAQGGVVLSELAATVDLTVSGNSWAANSPGFGLDLGAAFFSVSENTVTQSANAGVYLLYGVHDGSFTGNHIGYVAATTNANAVGLLVLGSWNITVTGNDFTGGAGASSVGVKVEPYRKALPLPDTNVTVSNNTFGNWATTVEE